MRTRQHIDFHVVEPHQREMDARLANWAKWCRGSGAPACSPMFRMVPPPPKVRRDASFGIDAVDGTDAQRIAKAVTALPKQHCAAINWHYVTPTSPVKACRSLGCTMEGLYQLVRDARQMLINRGA